MKYLSLLFSFLFFSTFVLSQDLIISNTNDSISGKIQNEINGKLIYLHFENHSQQNDYINSHDIKEIISDFYTQKITDTIQLKKLHSHYLITNDNRKIYCNIYKNDPNFIYYSEIINGQEVSKSIDVLEVYSSGETKAMENEKSDQKEMFKKVHFKFSAGLSYRLGEIPKDKGNDFTNYIKDLNKGHYYSLTASYYWSKNWGMGFVYDRFSSQSDIMISLTDENGEIVGQALMYSDLLMSYFGGEAHFRLSFAQDQFLFIGSIGLGAQQFNQSKRIYNLKERYKGLAFSSNMEASLAWKPTSYLGFYVNTSFISGNLFSAEYSFDGKTENMDLAESPESVTRVGIGLGIIFILKPIS